MSRDNTSADRDRCLPAWMGRSIQRERSLRRLESPCGVSEFERTRDDGSIDGHQSLREAITRLSGTGYDRQHFHGSVYKQQRRPEPQFKPVSTSHLGRGNREWNHSSLRAYCGRTELRSGPVVQNARPSQLDVTSSSVRVYRENIWQTHDRSVRELPKYTNTQVQQSILGTTVRGCRCACSKQLACREQLCKRAVLHDSACIRRGGEAQSLRHDHRSGVEGSDLVSATGKNVNKTADHDTEQATHIYTDGRDAGAAPEPEVESVCLESIWRAELRELGWSSECIDRLKYCIANGTIKSYDNIINKLLMFCKQYRCSFPPTQTAVLADFLREAADRSERPNSVLRTSVAAIGHLYNAKGMDNLVQCPLLKMLVTGLVKSGTVAPMVRSKVMPVKRFHDLFLEWPDNETLDINRLRLKTITLLALTLMLRPSDIAPHSILFVDGREESIVFNSDQVQINEHGAKFTFFGIKNDASRSGFEVNLPRGTDEKIDPVNALQDYMHRTSHVRPKGGPVFLSLRAPYQALKSSSIAKILEKAISLAGLDGHGYSAKSFRPTGATSAIDQGVNAEITRKIGRWKNSEVFFAHYVHSNAPSSFTDDIINHA